MNEYCQPIRINDACISLSVTLQALAQHITQVFSLNPLFVRKMLRAGLFGGLVLLCAAATTAAVSLQGKALTVYSTYSS